MMLNDTQVFNIKNPNVLALLAIAKYTVTISYHYTPC